MRPYRLAYLLAALAVCPMLLACSLFSSDKEKEKERTYSSNRVEMEHEAQSRLALARSQMAKGDYTSARSTIEAMRKECYLAIEARTQGIVVMDSVCLLEAQAELARIDSLMHVNSTAAKQSDFDEACRKVQFYERKIRHDSQPSDTEPSKEKK